MVLGNVGNNPLPLLHSPPTRHPVQRPTQRIVFPDPSLSLPRPDGASNLLIPTTPELDNGAVPQGRFDAEECDGSGPCQFGIASAWIIAWI